VALDVSDDALVAAWRRAEEPVQTLTVANSDEGVERLVAKIGATRVWAVYETSGVGFVLHDKLTKLGWRVSVLATTRLARSVRARKRKTDAEDARRLLDVLVAHVVCGNELPAVWVPPVKTREDREVVRLRLDLGETLGRIRTKIKALLKVHGLKYPGHEKTAWTRKYMAWLRGLSSPEGGLERSLWASLASHLRLLEAAQTEIAQLGEEVQRLAQEPHYCVQVTEITKIPGVGLLTALVFLLELGDVRRFKNRRQVGSYLGLTPNSYESGPGDERKGHISRMGPKRVRKVLNQAAWSYMRTQPLEMEWYRRVAYRRGKKRALVALMRRLGITIWQRARLVA
jgi:transposase